MSVASGAALHLQHVFSLQLIVASISSQRELLDQLELEAAHHKL